MKTSIFKLSALSALIAFPLSALAAEDISYSYIELDYVIQDIDLYEDDEAFNDVIEDADDGDGYNLAVSFGVTESVFLFGSYTQTTADYTFVNDEGTFIPEDQDIKTLNLGLGFHVPLSTTTDFVARAAYMDVDYGEFSFGQVDNDVADDDETVGDAFDDLNEDTSDGYMIDLGVRSQVAYWLELGGGVRYTDVDSGDDIAAFGSALFEITPNMGINLDASFGDNLSTYQLGFRYSM